MTEPSRPEIDIEAIARDMTDTRGPASLHARVMAQLDHAPIRRWTHVPIVRMAAACAVIVAAVAALTLRGPVGSPLPDRAALPPLPQSAALATPATPTPPEPPDAPPATRRSTPPRVVPPPPSPAALEAEAAWRARSVPALASLAAVELDTIQPETVAIPLLEVTPLTSARVALGPLGDPNPSGVR